VEPELDDTQNLDISAGLEDEIARLLARLERLLAARADDPRHRLMAAAILMWDDWPDAERRFQAAANLLTLDQRDVWFLAANDPVAALDDAASRLLIALGDAVTAAGANFYFDTGEPFTPAGNADEAYRQLGAAIGEWKSEVLQQHRRRRPQQGLGAAAESQLQTSSAPDTRAPT
jgi:hypothetical protein